MSIGQKPRVFAVVFSQGKNDSLIRCLDNLYASSYVGTEVVVIDNGSEGFLFDVARKKFSRFHFIKNSKMVGFSEACNLAVRFAMEKMADLILVLDQRIILGKSTIEVLVRELTAREDMGIASPIVLNESGSQFFFAGSNVSWKKMSLLILDQLQTQEPFQSKLPSEMVLMLKGSVFEKAGLFDENISSPSFSCSDLALRASRAKLGCLVVPRAGSYKEAGNEKEGSYDTFEDSLLSKIIFFKKNSSGLGRLKINAVFFWESLYSKIASILTRSVSAKIKNGAFEKYRSLKKIR